MTGVRVLMVCGLTLFPLICGSLPLVTASAQESGVTPGEEPPPAPPEAPPPSAPPPKEEEKIPPPTPPALPGAPAPVEPLDIRAPGPAAPPPAPGLFDRFLRRLELLPPGRIFLGVSAEEEYDDNVFRASSGEQHDFRTVIVPVLVLEETRPTTALRLQYTPRILKYVRFPELDRVDHSLVAAASWHPSPRLRLSVQESLLRTEDPVEASALGIRQTGLRRTTRNEVSPGLEYKLTPLSDLALQYTNTITDEEDVGADRGDDSTIHSGKIALRHRLREGEVGLNYTFTSAEFTESSDFLGHEANVNATWRLGPRDELLLTGGGIFRDRRQDTDFIIVSGGAGLRHAFTPLLSGTLTAGVQQFDERGKDPEYGFFTDSNLTWTFPRGSLTARVENRFAETFATVDNVGVVDVLRGSVSFSYEVVRDLFLSIGGSYAREDFEEAARRDLINTARVEIRYRLSRLFSLNAGYERFDRNSDAAGQDLATNRVFIGLSLGPAPLPF